MNQTRTAPSQLRSSHPPTVPHRGGTIPPLKIRHNGAHSAEKYLVPAAEKLPNNAVIQDHMGDLFAKRGKWQDAINAWTRALSGEGGDLNHAVVQKKIDDARSKVKR